MSRHEMRLDNPVGNSNLLIPCYSVYEDPLVITGAQGHYVQTQYGDLLDLNSGYWTAILGHKRTEVAEAMSSGYFAHLYGDLHPHAIGLAKDLCRRTGYSRILFTTSGTEATDTAIRIAWQCSLATGHPTKREILTVNRAFHGTCGLSLFTSGFEHRRRWLPLGIQVKTLGLWVTEDKLNSDEVGRNIESSSIHWKKLGSFIFEPVLGVGGIRPLNQNTYRLIATECKQAGALVIADEVTTGMGRTGSFLASETFSPKPDIVCLGKALTNGEFPLAAVLVSEKVWQSIDASSPNYWEKFLFGYTYGGHPAGCLAAMKVLEILDNESLLDKVQEKGMWLEKKLRDMADSSENSLHVRGRGLMWGIELPSRSSAEKVYKLLIKDGVRIGREGRTLIVMPSFTITLTELADALKKLERVIGLS